MTSKGLLIASTAALLPLGSFFMLAALGVGGAVFLVAFVKEFGSPATTNDPSRCPACQRDELMRIDASITPAPIPLLHCRGCGEAFRWTGGTFYRDTGRPLF